MTLRLFPLIDTLFNSLKRKRQSVLDLYASILYKHFPQFKRLSAADQQLFAERVYRFRKSKTIHFLEMEESEDIAVLVSAAAIQLTFGLPKFHFGFFTDIYIISGAYTYGLSQAPWAGHVNREGIHVAWDHVMKGYASENDGYNVGLHEMAHALEYEIAYGDYMDDMMLRRRFNQVIYVIKDTVFRQQEQPVSAIFSEQGLTNVHECWAESVEFFFEDPAKLKDFYPELYEAICLLLNRRPL